jgi:hypothetical protein
MANRATAKRFLLVDYVTNLPRGATDSIQLAIGRDFVPPRTPTRRRGPRKDQPSPPNTSSLKKERRFARPLTLCGPLRTRPFVMLSEAQRSRNIWPQTGHPRSFTVTPRHIGINCALRRSRSQSKEMDGANGCTCHAVLCGKNRDRSHEELFGEPWRLSG